MSVPETDDHGLDRAARHEIRIGKRRIAFAARPAARQLLYAFATAPSHHLTRAMICSAAIRCTRTLCAGGGRALRRARLHGALHRGDPPALSTSSCPIALPR